MPQPRWLFSALLTAVVIALPGRVHAQITTPTFQGARSGSDVGASLSATSDGGGALEGILRRRYGTYDLGFRVGLLTGGDAAVTLGGDFRNPFQLGIPPLDAAITAGVQGVIGNDSGVGAQVGVIFGSTFLPEDATFTISPYVQPRIAVLNGLRDVRGTEIYPLADVGVNLDFPPNVSVRVGLGVGHGGASFGAGFAIR